MYEVGGYHFRINALLVLGKGLEMDILSWMSRRKVESERQFESKCEKWKKPKVNKFPFLAQP